jgi:hypothetical protein
MNNFFRGDSKPFNRKFEKMKGTFWNDLEPEEKLILQLLNYNNFNEIDCAKINEQISAVQEWRNFEKMALNSHLAPLFYSKIRDNDELNFSTETKSFLHGVYNKNLSRNIILLQAFEKLSFILKSKNIRFVTLKGLWLLERVYSDIGVRHISDYDILFNISELDIARKVLIDSGYHEELTDHSELLMRLIKSPTPFIYRKNNDIIDFHIYLNNPSSYHLEIDFFWNSAYPVVAGESQLEFPIELRLIYQTLHLYKHIEHNSIKFIWIVDISIIIRSNNISWEKIKGYCELFNCSMEFEHTIYFVEGYFFEKLTPIIFSNLNDWKKREIIEKQKLIFTKNELKHAKTTVLEILLLDLSNLNPIKKILAIILRVFPSKKFIQSKYGEKSNYLFFLVYRPLKFLFKH